jgi:hypothetical protein
MRTGSLLCWIAAALLLVTPGVAGAAERKTVLMHYMPWYQTPDVSGRWGEHWTGWSKQHNPDALDENGQPDIWSHYRPLIGLYDSADEAVLECQLLQMKLAGIDGVIADWYGIARAADYPPIHAATQKLFAKAGELGMSFAVCYEDRTIEYLLKLGKLEEAAIGSHLAETFQWTDRAWFGADHYVRVDGRPLVLNFGPIFVKDGSAWDHGLAAAEPRPAFYALHHLWRGVGADGGFTWVHPDVWSGSPDADEIQRRLAATFGRVADDSRRIITSALPGFRDVYEHSHPVVEHRAGYTMRETMTAALRSPSPIVQLVTWNDYGEGTMIEPTHEFGYLFLEIIQELRRAEAGSAISFNSDDLRLPARLLELRRTQRGDEGLDQIARDLASGRVAEARRGIEALEARP